MDEIDFELRGEHIALDALLKATGAAPSGGAAKALVATGRVQVDGHSELRKTCKIRAGQVVTLTVALQALRIAVRAGARGD
jgi:ribosome-associated protein